VARDVAGQGLGTEGVCALVDHALADLPAGLGLQRVTALIAQENLASVRVASRAGLRRAPGLRVSVDDGTHESLHDVYTLEVRATGT
jgi:RimJ/RimL family protein N-acetyltransferase